MTDAERMTLLREAVGDSAIERLSGLDRRTIQRVSTGDADLYPDTAERIRQQLLRAAALFGEPSISASEARVRELIARKLPGSPPMVLRTALHLADHSPVRLPDLCEAVTGDRYASGPNVAVRQMADCGLASIAKAATGRGMVVTWEGGRRS